jgi:hypothetical protein
LKILTRIAAYACKCLTTNVHVFPVVMNSIQAVRFDGFRALCIALLADPLLSTFEIAVNQTMRHRLQVTLHQQQL